MNIATDDLINDLVQRTGRNKSIAQKLLEKPLIELNWKPEASRWSVLECLEHLNRYGDFYLPEINKRIEQSQAPKETIFRSGLLGNYFAKSMLPKKKLNKMKTFKSMDPLGSSLSTRTIEKFIAQQDQTMSFLEKSRNVSLSKTKTSISISNWVKLKLGDTFRVVIYHNERHIAQVNNIIRLYAESA